MQNEYFGQDVTLSDPFHDAVAVTPADDERLSVEIKYLYIGTTGDLVLKFSEDGDEITFSNVPVGFFPGRPWYIMESSTASDIVGCL